MSKQNPYRFAILGCGRVAPFHARAIKKLPNARLVAVCDINKDQAESFGKEFNARAYTSDDKLFEQEKPDIVTVCTPSHLHVKTGIAAAKRGIHVICEKPLATTVEEGQKLVDACKRYNVKLACCFQNRFNAPVQEAKQLIEKQQLGKMYLASIVVRWARTQDYYDDNWHGNKTLSGGGVLMTQAIHFVDMLLYLLGKPTHVFGSSKTLKFKTNVEDTFVGILKFPSGNVATLEASTVVYPHNLEASITLLAKHGSLKIGGLAADKKEFWYTENQKMQRLIRFNSEASVYGQNHKLLFADFLDALENNSSPISSGEDGLATQLVIESLYKSAKLNKETAVVFRLNSPHSPLQEQRG